ncbi:bifunctional molybdopterin-guanine dinucleotide biosynthesis adaptor protein MobB/molybdopterin molybdotransferase MoeA [Amphritea sp. HPY]|uniref:bifunctional molybdopterin-guanine dinucleotide biosynthesis adaptor protein MobB/molybdopterin molybdotransferase MoeA n=1 Tax=Amphritea sp. HPY TaxID=3421652 RepID=UPI003D7D1784
MTETIFPEANSPEAVFPETTASEPLSCFDPAVNGGAMLPVAESIERILSQLSWPQQNEEVALAEAVNRVLAQDQISTINVPQQTNSAMDGYAICAAALKENEQQSFKVVGQVFAGGSYPGTVSPGEAVEIMTGAPVPAGTDSIIMREMTELQGDQMTFSGPVAVGQHVRQRGEDISAGSAALSAGCLIRPQEQGLLASLGMQKVKVYRQLTVAVFSTGDEVVPQGQPLPENCIYDTNRFTLMGLLQRMGCKVIDLGIIEDNQQVMESTLSEAAGQADMVISSGGVSMGQADYIKLALQAVGEINFWRIAMRPGRPLAFGQLGSDTGTVAGKETGTDTSKTPFFGLPGNPVAVMVTFLQFVQPALRKMMGQRDWQPVRMTAVAEHTLKSRLNRIDYSRGIYRINDQGQLVVSSTGAQGSGILTSMVQANCLIEIGEPLAQVEAGQSVLIQPFGD